MCVCEIFLDTLASVSNKPEDCRPSLDPIALAVANVDNLSEDNLDDDEEEVVESEDARAPKKQKSRKQRSMYKGGTLF